MCLIALSAGCSRLKYRLMADKEVHYLVAQKSNDPRWDYPTYTIGMDPRSRYFDPTDADNPPMPYDDPASHRYMHCVAGKKAYPCWHMGGDWYYLENPTWKDLLGQYNEMTDDGAIKLSMNGAVCLAQVHSSDYRSQIETIYLSALDVSTERFRFDVQWFGNSDTIFSHLGPERSPTGMESNTLTQGVLLPDTSARLEKRLSTGGELIVGFANNVVWQFAGPNTNVTTSLINLSFVQPLLKGGGRVVALEQLTIVERALLANLRAFQRYRQGFYTAMTVGNGIAGNVQGPQRRGGFFGGTGLTGFSGQGAGGQGGVGSQQFGISATNFGGGGGGGGGIGFVSGSAGGVGGFVGLLQQVQQVRNAQANLDAQLRTLGLLESNLNAGLIDIVQVDQFRQNIESARANLLGAQVTYETQLDLFKAQLLAMPPDIKVEIDDSMLQQFQYLDPKTTRVQHLVDDFVDVIGELPEDPAPADVANALQVISRLRGQVGEEFARAQDDLTALDNKIPQRKATMTAKENAVFNEDVSKLRQSLAEVSSRFANTEGVLASIRERVGQETPRKLTDEIVALATGISGMSQELLLVKARARLEAVTVPRIKMTSEKALDIARANRLDWMNNRAALVDQWRLIAFNANSLRTGLDLFANGGLGNVGNNPVAFNGQNGAMQVGLRFDAPFTRRLERNNYRSVLIQYQYQRRQLYQFQDGVNFTLRNLLRTLDQLEVNLEIQRRAMVIAIRRVDKTREDLSKPPAPVLPGQPVETLGPTAAQNLIFALNDLLSSQNVFMSVILNHYENRMLLYRELGIMELDDCGIWIDRPINDAEWLSEDQCPMPPAVPQEWIQDAGLSEEEVQAYAARRAAQGERDPSATFVEIPPVLAERPSSEAPTAANRPLSGPGSAVSRVAPRMPSAAPRLMPSGEAEPMVEESANWRAVAASKSAAGPAAEAPTPERPKETASGPILRR